MLYYSGCLTFQPFLLTFISAIPFPSENQPANQPISLDLVKFGVLLVILAILGYNMLGILLSALCEPAIMD